MNNFYYCIALLKVPSVSADVGLFSGGGFINVYLIEQSRSKHVYQNSSEQSRN
jgi:hypothetical protein